jgi:hypothetical protein
MFDDSLCGLKKLPKNELSYRLEKVTCSDCMEAARLEAIENQKALDKLPHCPHCGGQIASVTLTFTVTKSYRFDIQTERSRADGTNVLIYGTDSDTLDKELVHDKEWQVVCENGDEWFTRMIEPLEDGEQWVLTGKKDEVDFQEICPVCNCDRSEHNWEVHTAELKAGNITSW